MSGLCEPQRITLRTSARNSFIFFLTYFSLLRTGRKSNLAFTDKYEWIRNFVKTTTNDTSDSDRKGFEKDKIVT